MTFGSNFKDEKALSVKNSKEIIGTIMINLGENYERDIGRWAKRLLNQSSVTCRH